MNIKKHERIDVELSEVSFTCQEHEYSYDAAVASGELVSVTSWVSREMGFAPGRYRIQVAVTARLWKTIVRISPLAKTWQTVTGRGNDVLWLAAYALQKARQVGDQAANFDCFLPTDDDWGSEAIKPLRAERRISEGRPVVVIGYREDWIVLNG